MNTLTPNPHAPAPPAPPAIRDWRDHLLQGLLRLGLLAGALPVATSTLRAWHGDGWWAPATGLAALAACALLLRQPQLPQRWRAWAGVGLLFGIGLWLLARVGAMAQPYLMAAAVIAVLLLGVRPSIMVLGAGTLAFAGIGWHLNLPITIAGLDDRPGVKWINIGANFLFVGSLLALSCAYVLKRLEQSLATEREAHDTLRRSEESLHQIASQVPGMVFRVMVHGATRRRLKFLYVSPGARSLLCEAPEALLADGWLLHRLVHPDDRRRLDAEWALAMDSHTPFACEFRVRCRDGSERWLHLSAREESRSAESVILSGMALDITERRASEALVWQQAHFDALTGLPNRVLMRERLEQALAASRGAGRPFWLMLIDLDQFKEVNDAMGHDCGDLLLVEAAERLTQFAGPGDTVARMGGDEFTLLLTEPHEPAAIDALAQRVIAALARAFALGDEQAHISASIGIARFPDDAGSIEELLKHADQALYVAKDGGRNRAEFFTPRLQHRAQQRMRLANDLRGALGRGELHLVYQPIVDLVTGQVRKAEALLRWTHPERGPVSPAEFIPIAEATGLINEIGDWVFRSAAAQVAQWRRSLHPQFQVSVNRSPVQFRNPGDDGARWARHLDALGLPGDSIVVEITEGLLLDTGPGVSAQLMALRSAGIPVSLDDFGTGYSAMSYLQKFDIDYLKIDRSFVSGLTQGETARALCRAMIVMAHELGLRVIAEGVETDQQCDWLRAAGCDHAQGYLFARPLPPAEFEAFIARRRLRAFGDETAPGLASGPASSPACRSAALPAPSTAASPADA